MDAYQVVRTVRRLAARLSPESEGLEALRRFVREVSAAVEDVDTRSDGPAELESAPEPESEPILLTEALAELIRLGVLYYSCDGCGKPRGACLSFPQCAASSAARLALDPAVLARLAAPPSE